jgi:hypothetical protein
MSLLLKTGIHDSSGGRKPKLYKINTEKGYIIGVDIGGTNLRAVLGRPAWKSDRFYKNEIHCH